MQAQEPVSQLRRLDLLRITCKHRVRRNATGSLRPWQSSQTRQSNPPDWSRGCHFILVWMLNTELRVVRVPSVGDTRLDRSLHSLLAQRTITPSFQLLECVVSL